MKRLFAVAAFAAMLTVAACGSSAGGTGASTNGSAGGGGGAQHGTATITIMDFGYMGDLTVKPGQHVTVLNKDDVTHTLTDKADGRFDTGTISGGDSGSFVAPMTPGKYPFGCTLHPEMSGMLTVANG
jgi:plastocyanin